ncbi:Uncharacterised protein [Shigella sonnei]|nr:Uncharacterised protein [Shigella sonnei]CSG45910.1 Uncharacterised protein [Shigella sonnei]CSQ22167.1 Uncharacterised protein [Shigella sonnei]
MTFGIVGRITEVVLNQSNTCNMGVVADVDVTFNIQSHSGTKTSGYQTIIICLRCFTVCIQISIGEVEGVKIIVNSRISDVQSEDVAINPVVASIIATVGPDVVAITNLVRCNHTMNN